MKIVRETKLYISCKIWEENNEYFLYLNEQETCAQVTVGVKATASKREAKKKKKSAERRSLRRGQSSFQGQVTRSTQSVRKTSRIRPKSYFQRNEIVAMVVCFGNSNEYHFSVVCLS